MRVCFRGKAIPREDGELVMIIVTLSVDKVEQMGGGGGGDQD